MFSPPSAAVNSSCSRFNSQKQVIAEVVWLKEQAFDDGADAAEAQRKVRARKTVAERRRGVERVSNCWMEWQHN